MRALPVGILVLFAAPAWSLSCVVPDIARDYQHAAEADETYIVVKGDLRFDARHLPKVDWENQMDTPQQTDIPARLTGHAMTLKGFAHPFDNEITLRVLCFGPWCGGTGQGTHLAFIERTGSEHIMTVSPCPGMSYHTPTAEIEAQVLSCARGKGCDPSQ